MSEGLSVFTVGMTAATRQEAARLDVGLKEDVIALDGMAARLRLCDALPSHIEAVVDYDPDSYNRDIRQSKCETPAEGSARLWVKAHKLDEPTVTRRLAEALFTHPDINPAVPAWYEDQDWEYTKARCMLYGGMYGVPLLVAGGFYANKLVDNADYVSVGLATVSALVAVAGLLKQADQTATAGAQPHMPFVEDLAPPVQIRQRAGTTPPRVPFHRRRNQ